MFSYQREVLGWDNCDELESITVDHFKEAKHDWNGHFHHDPDRERYKQLEDMGKLRYFTCRKDGQLIGYALFFISRSIQCKAQVQAVCHMVFIKKEHRGEGLPFIQWCERQLESHVDLIIYTVKPFHDYSPMLKMLGHELLETYYARRTV